MRRPPSKAATTTGSSSSAVMRVRMRQFLMEKSSFNREGAAGARLAVSSWGGRMSADPAAAGASAESCCLFRRPCTSFATSCDQSLTRRIGEACVRRSRTGPRLGTTPVVARISAQHKGRNKIAGSGKIRTPDKWPSQNLCPIPPRYYRLLSDKSTRVWREYREVKITGLPRNSVTYRRQAVTDRYPIAFARLGLL
ncbi:hypothetical protein GCM10023205_01600 [Yinghuangia aomiensis]|uniref:Uncharacterized protein n=1 Tax=Yinghuangia aomiensis TaxID=676205 RepID=A0ABP9GNC9_9ACTN